MRHPFLSVERCAAILEYESRIPVFTKNDLCDTENDGKTSSDNQWFISFTRIQGSKDPSEQPDDQSCRGEDYQPIERSSTDVEIIERSSTLYRLD